MKVEPNVAVEMKWSYLTKQGYFSRNWEKSIKNDLVKLHRNKTKSEKYFMQFLFIPKNHFKKFINKNIIINNIIEQVNKIIDHRILKNKAIELVYDDSFETYGIEENDKYNFTILLWHIV